MWLLHGEVGDVGISGDLKLKDALTSGGVAVEQGAVHRGESVAGDDRGLDGEFLDVRFGLLQSKSKKKERRRSNNDNTKTCTGGALAKFGKILRRAAVITDSYSSLQFSSQRKLELQIYTDSILRGIRARELRSRP